MVYSVLTASDPATAKARVLVRRRPAEGASWEAPVELVAADARVAAVRVAMANDGTAVV